MPEEIHPGVCVEEVSYRAKSIEGVDTTTAGFVGETAGGPTDEPREVASLAEFHRSYGGGGYLSHAASAFFAQGGRRLFVQRVEEDEYERALEAFETIPEIAVVAAPGATIESGGIEALVDHAERMRYRIAVLDSGQGQTPEEVAALREGIDSSYATLYYPWVRASDAVTGTEIDLPPSGFVAGIYARNDIERGIHKAPANELLRGVAGLERTLHDSEYRALGECGINCLRAFARGDVRLWGARTTSSDPEWKYVNLRRYFAYLEHSIDRGTQWTVFEPNSEELCASVRSVIEDFLATEWRTGALQGSRPEEAFFVKCDRSTMTQNDLDNGRLVCMIGVATVRPAEFVIIRIGQWTADRRCP